MTIIRKFGSAKELHSHAVKIPGGCWEWRRFTIDGYGQVKVNNKNMAAHRYSFLISKGPIKKNWLVCHTCDNRKCIRPSHLFQGTCQDNMDDMKRKGRSPNNKFESNPKAKLTMADVKSIRDIGHSKPYKITAKTFGVTPEMISMIVRYKHWVVA